MWPLDEQEMADLRWYLEQYLRMPFGVYEQRGPRVAERLPEWGARIFSALFATAEAKQAYTEARTRGGQLEIVLRSGSAERLGLPWELMADPARPVPIALDQVAISRSLQTADTRHVFTVPGSRLRVLMVISRPDGEADVGYQMIARPLLRRLEAVRGSVDLVVLRPPTLKRLEEVLTRAREDGEPFQVVHFDGHGVFGRPPASGGWGPMMFQQSGPQGMLAFEKTGGGSDLVPAGRVAQVLAGAQVPVAVLNACQSAVVGSQVEAAVATRLMQEGVASVVAMAYSVYAVAAAEFMAAFYERLFAGDRMAEAVAAGRRRLALNDERPSLKGMLPLDDWMVPVFYTRSEVRFPGLRTERESEESLDGILDAIRRRPEGGQEAGPGQELAPEGEFIGRDALFYRLDVAARLQRVVVLHGPGGTGKTELAKAFGRWCRDTGAVDRPEWVIWHSFEPGVASFGLDGVINAIGRRVFGEKFDTQFVLLDAAQRQEAVERALKTRRVLLLWDNFESVRAMPDPGQATPPLPEREQGEMRAFLSRLARDSRTSVVITSRSDEEWLGEGIRRIRVDGLDTEEATQYAEQLLAPYPHTRKTRESRAFGEVMQWLDGHPLSMRLVLPHLDTTSAQDLLDGLRGIRALPGRGEGPYHLAGREHRVLVRSPVGGGSAGHDRAESVARGGGRECTGGVLALAGGARAVPRPLRCHMGRTAGTGVGPGSLVAGRSRDVPDPSGAAVLSRRPLEVTGGRGVRRPAHSLRPRAAGDPCRLLFLAQRATDRGTGPARRGADRRPPKDVGEHARLRPGPAHVDARADRCPAAGRILAPSGFGRRGPQLGPAHAAGRGGTGWPPARP